MEGTIRYLTARSALAALLLAAPGSPAGAGGDGGPGHAGPGHAAHHAPASAEPLAAVWEPEGDPPRITDPQIGFTDQDGEAGTLADLLDRPLLVTFFYTRCQNSKKCPMSVSRLAGLQRRLQAEGLAGRVHLVAVTFEPQYDTPDRIKSYAVNRGLTFEPTARALRLAPERQQELIDDLRVPVSYNGGWVNGHAVELSLLDAEGTMVRKYQALGWDNRRVVEDLRRLLGGDDGEAPTQAPAREADR